MTKEIPGYKLNKLPKTEQGWIDLFKNIYGKDPTTRELSNETEEVEEIW